MREEGAAFYENIIFDFVDKNSTRQGKHDNIYCPHKAKHYLRFVWLQWITQHVNILLSETLKLISLNSSYPMLTENTIKELTQVW